MIRDESSDPLVTLNDSHIDKINTDFWNDLII